MIAEQMGSRAGGLDILYAGTLPPHPGGSAVMCGQLLVGLARRGHTIRAVAPIVEEDAPRGASFAEGCPSLSVIRYAAPSYVTVPDFVLPAYSAQLEVELADARRAMLAQIAARRPDVILLGREPCLWYLPDEPEGFPAPVLLISHSLMTHRLMRGTYPEHLRAQVLPRYRRAQRIATPAFHFAEFLKSLGLHEPTVIPNPVDMDLFAPRPKDPSLLRELSIDRNDFVVAHVSNLKAVKRPMDLVASAEAVLKEKPDAIYLIVGEGEYRPIIRQACEERGILSRFRFTGWVDHGALPAYLNLADIVVMPSELETQALVYLEAMAMGRLLLASDIAGARQVVVDGENGLLFRMGDVADLTAQTLVAASDADLRERIGRAARRSVQPHSIDRVAAQYDALLRETAAG